VLQGAGAASAGPAAVSAQSARGGRITVTVQEDPSQSTTVSGNGSFKLENVPATGFTLVFSVNGVVLGSVAISPVPATTKIKIKIVVQLTDHVELVDLEMNDENEDQGDQAQKTCMINGGRRPRGEHIELEGVVASGGSDQFQLRVNGNRSSGLGTSPPGRELQVQRGQEQLRNLHGEGEGRRAGAREGNAHRLHDRARPARPRRK